MHPRRPDPPPIRTDHVRTVAIGTALWAVALVALLPFRDELDRAGRLWWYGAAAAGFVLGLIGIVYCRRRAAAIAREESVSTGNPPLADPPAPR